MVEGIDAKTRQAVNLKRIVDLEKLFVVFALPVVHDVVHHGVDLLVVQRLDVDAAHIAVHPNHGRQACREVQIRRFVFNAEREQLGDVHGVLFVIRWGQS